MPISSGASGRVDVGVDKSKRWAPDGVNARPVIIQHDSYLLRYQAFQELQKKNNKLEVPTVQYGSDPTDFKKDGVEEVRKTAVKTTPKEKHQEENRPKRQSRV